VDLRRIEDSTKKCHTPHMRRRLVRALLCFFAAPLLLAQTPDPLGPQAGKIKTFVGTWKLEGVVKAVEATGATDSGAVSYTQVGKLVNDGAMVQVQRTGTGPRGPVQELWLYSYNRVTKTYRMDANTGRSAIRNFTIKIKDDTWSFTGQNTSIAGVSTLERFTITFNPEMTSGTVRSEHSTDGKEWFERLTGTYTRVSEPAPAG
jgi:hypothetical protein